MTKVYFNEHKTSKISKICSMEKKFWSYHDYKKFYGKQEPAKIFEKKWKDILCLKTYTKKKNFIPSKQEMFIDSSLNPAM